MANRAKEVGEEWVLGPNQILLKKKMILKMKKTRKTEKDSMPMKTMALQRKKRANPIPVSFHWLNSFRFERRSPTTELPIVATIHPTKLGRAT